MAALVGEEVVSAVATSIRASFSSTEIKKIYKNKPPEQMETPCAFVKQLNQDFSREMRGRGELSYLINVRVHPDPLSNVVESWAMKTATRLISALEEITIDSRPARFSSMDWRCEDGVLLFTIGYSFKVIKEKTAVPFMEQITLTERVK